MDEIHRWVGGRHRMAESLNGHGQQQMVRRFGGARPFVLHSGVVRKRIQTQKRRPPLLRKKLTYGKFQSPPRNRGQMSRFRLLRGALHDRHRFRPHLQLVGPFGAAGESLGQPTAVFPMEPARRERRQPQRKACRSRNERRGADGNGNRFQRHFMSRRLDRSRWYGSSGVSGRQFDPRSPWRIHSRLGPWEGRRSVTDGTEQTKCHAHPQSHRQLLRIRGWNVRRSGLEHRIELRRFGHCSRGFHHIEPDHEQHYVLPSFGGRFPGLER